MVYFWMIYLTIYIYNHLYTYLLNIVIFHSHVTNYQGVNPKKLPETCMFEYVRYPLLRGSL